MAVSFPDNGATEFHDANASSTTVPFLPPTTIAAGDVWICCAVFRLGSAGTISGVPAGFHLISRVDQGSASTACTIVAYWYVATGSETSGTSFGSITLSAASKHVTTALPVRGGSSSTPVTGTVVTGTGTTQATSTALAALTTGQASVGWGGNQGASTSQNITGSVSGTHADAPFGATSGGSTATNVDEGLGINLAATSSASETWKYPDTAQGSTSCVMAFILAPSTAAASAIPSTKLRRVQRIAPQPERARHDQPVPPQAAPNTNQPVKVSQSQARRKLGFGRRGRVAAPPWPQQAAPVVTAVPDSGQARVFRGWRLARGRRAEVVPTQVIPPVVAYPFTEITRRTIRNWITRRPRILPLPAEQNIPTVVTARRTVKGWSRRGRTVTPPLAQVNPPYPVAGTSQRRAYRGWTARKSRRAEVTAAQQAAPVNPAFVTGRTQRRVLRGWFQRHGDQPAPIPAQQTPVTPTKVWQAPARRLRFVTGRRKAGVTPVAQQSIVIPQQRRRPATAPSIRRRRTLRTFAVQAVVVAVRGLSRGAASRAATGTGGAVPTDDARASIGPAKSGRARHSRTDMSRGGHHR